LLPRRLRTLLEEKAETVTPEALNLDKVAARVAPQTEVLPFRMAPTGEDQRLGSATV
jgi:hypothetical protein